MPACKHFRLREDSWTKLWTLRFRLMQWLFFHQDSLLRVEPGSLAWFETPSLALCKTQSGSCATVYQSWKNCLNFLQTTFTFSRLCLALLDSAWQCFSGIFCLYHTRTSADSWTFFPIIICSIATGGPSSQWLIWGVPHTSISTIRWSEVHSKSYLYKF